MLFIRSSLQPCKGADSGYYPHFTQSPERSIQLPQAAQLVGAFSPWKLSAFFTMLYYFFQANLQGNLKNPQSSNFNSLPPVPSTADRSERTPSWPSCCPPILPAGVPSSVFLLSPSPTTRQHAVEQSSSTGYHWPLGQFFISQGCPLGQLLNSSY